MTRRTSEANRALFSITKGAVAADWTISTSTGTCAASPSSRSRHGHRNHPFQSTARGDFRHPSMLDKYINDAIMTFWSGPGNCRITHSAPLAGAGLRALTMSSVSTPGTRRRFYRRVQHRLDWTVIGDLDKTIGRTEGVLRRCGRSRSVPRCATPGFHRTLLTTRSRQDRGLEEQVHLFEHKWDSS